MEFHASSFQQRTPTCCWLGRGTRCQRLACPSPPTRTLALSLPLSLYLPLLLLLPFALTRTTIASLPSCCQSSDCFKFFNARNTLLLLENVALSRHGMPCSSIRHAFPFHRATSLFPSSFHSVSSVSKNCPLTLILLLLQTVRLYDVGREGHQLKTQCDNGTAVLDTCFGGDATAFAAGLDGSINRCSGHERTDTLLVMHVLTPFLVVLLFP